MRSSLLPLSLLVVFLLGFNTLPALSVAAAAASRQVEIYNHALTSSSGYIDIDSNDFQSIIHAPRNFAVTVLLTATDSAIKCGPCKLFQPNFDNVARSWNRKSNPNRTKNVFVKAEFSRAKEIFRLFQLQHAPVLYTFHATSDSQASEPAQFDFNRLGFDSVDVANYLSKTLDLPFAYTKPLDYKLIGVVISVLALLASSAVFIAPYLAALVSSSKPIWMIVCLAAIVTFTSGQMWNQIRNAPYVSAARDGSLQYFASGFQSQYGAETQIIAIIYALLAFSFVALTLLVPAQTDPARQRAGVYLWSAIFFSTFSVLLYIFRMKNPSYPFRLFF